MGKEMVVDLKSAKTEEHKYKVAYSPLEAAEFALGGYYWMTYDRLLQLKTAPKGTFGLDVNKKTNEITLFLMPTP